MAIISDIVEGEVGIDQGGYSVERQFIVTDLSGPAHARLYNAMTAPGIPTYGELHPVIPGIIVTSITASPEGAGKARVAVHYQLPDTTQREPTVTDPGVLQVGSTTQQTTTQEDKDGDQLKVEITFADGTTDKKATEVEIEVPQTMIQFQRREQYSPIFKSLEFVGTVNDSSIGYFDERTLLCTEIDGTSDDNGLTFNTNYTFQYRPDGWDATAAYVDEGTDQPHRDVNLSTGNGIATFRIYQEKDFGRLGLDFGFASTPPLGFSP